MKTKANTRRRLAGLLLGSLLYCAPALADDACHPAKPPSTAYGANPIMTYMIAAIAPDKLAGWNFAPPPQARGIFPEALIARPVLGGWFGQGQVPNLESLAALHPDVTLVSGVTVGTDRSRPVLERLGLPACEIRIDRVQDYPHAFRLAGQALGVPERGEALGAYAQTLLDALEQARAGWRSPAPRLYYAEGPDGLATECEGSIHAEVLALAGGSNVHTCPVEAGKDRFGMLRIDFEQLLRYDPDWIVTQEKEFVNKLTKDTRWKNLRAVREGRVLLMPQAPFRWMDRPPSYMRLLAAHWLAQRIHPESSVLDLRATTREFYRLFFATALDEPALDSLLSPEH